MRSLRLRLLLSLWLAVCIVGIGAAVVSYHRVNAQARELLDAQLKKIAAIAAAQTLARPNPEHAEDSDIDVSVWQPDGSLAYSSTARISVPRSDLPGFSETIFKGEPYRVYATDVAGRHIEVAQPIDVREDQAEAAAYAALLPALILLPVLGIVIALMIPTLLKPVHDIAEKVSQRDALSMRPLGTRDLPSEIVPLIDEINRLLERQSAALQRENDFIADAAHALRTPLAALQLQADVLEGARDPQERAARFSALREGIRRASQLSEELLSLARIATTADASGQSASLDATLHEVAALYRPAVVAASVSLSLQTDSGARIACDHRSLLLICTNLLDNAVRHSPAGGRIEMMSAASPEWARMEIRDQGPGLAQDQLERVFQRFYQASGRTGGSGLGLSTVASLVRRLGGRVSLENRTDTSGLIASVLLPYVAPGSSIPE